MPPFSTLPSSPTNNGIWYCFETFKYASNAESTVLLELLPDEFTLEQYRQMRNGQGRKGDDTSALRQWSARGYIVYDEVSGCYCKTESYKLKFSKK